MTKIVCMCCNVFLTAKSDPHAQQQQQQTHVPSSHDTLLFATSQLQLYLMQMLYIAEALHMRFFLSDGGFRLGAATPTQVCLCMKNCFAMESESLPEQATQHCVCNFKN